MALELLRELAAQRLPITVRDPILVDRIRLLRRTECIAALTSPIGSEHPFATVLCVTKRGREALELASKEDNESRARRPSPQPSHRAGSKVSRKVQWFTRSRPSESPFLTAESRSMLPPTRKLLGDTASQST